mmetsp:Transcript_23073/g.64405  ORF Transcript_23073/g.64405 Transcript_23073/m.64405 type:complete len:203 (-) Transcript_23073:241-849(-)
MPRRKSRSEFTRFAVAWMAMKDSTRAKVAVYPGRSKRSRQRSTASRTNCVARTAVKVHGRSAVTRPSKKLGFTGNACRSYFAICCSMVRAPTMETFFRMWTVRFLFSGEARRSQKGYGSRSQYGTPCRLIHQVQVMVLMKTSIIDVPFVSAVRPAVSKPEMSTKIAPKRPKMMCTRCRHTASSRGRGARAGATMESTSNSKW